MPAEHVFMYVVCIARNTLGSLVLRVCTGLRAASCCCSRHCHQVLDESHTIAATTKTTAVVKQLVANRRWCMTGYDVTMQACTLAVPARVCHLHIYTEVYIHSSSLSLRCFSVDSLPPRAFCRPPNTGPPAT